MALPFRPARFSFWIFAALSRRLANDQLLLLGSTQRYCILLSGYYDNAFRWSQPVLFGELAIMLWLLIRGAKVPALVTQTS